MQTKKKIKLTFCGGVGGVTGSNFLIETIGEEREYKIILDCGLYQGSRVYDKENLKPFPYNPKEIDALIVSHPHLDHTGRIPKFVKEGYRGPIFSTAPGRDIAELMLIDSMGVLKKDAAAEKLPVLYDEEDVVHTMALWQTHEYGEKFKIGPLTINLKDSGHVLGSCIIEITHGSKCISYTADLGNTPSPLLPDTEFVKDTNYLLIESVYGDRNHEDRNVRNEMLEDVIEETTKRGGTLLIPAFSLERTQEVLFEIKEMREKGRIPAVPVFLDSPLAIEVTKVYEKYLSYFKKDIRKKFRFGPDMFEFYGLYLSPTSDDSKGIKRVRGPKIIIAGSGMSNGGRIVHHEKEYLPDEKNTILFLGYQAPGTLGRRIYDGEKIVKIMGEMVQVNAQVKKISGYSAHKDSDGLLDFVHHAADTLEKVFVVLGEPKSSLYLVQKIRDNLGIRAEVPEMGQSVILDME